MVYLSDSFVFVLAARKLLSVWRYVEITVMSPFLAVERIKLTAERSPTNFFLFLFFCLAPQLFFSFFYFKFLAFLKKEKVYFLTGLEEKFCKYKFSPLTYLTSHGYLFK